MDDNSPMMKQFWQVKAQFPETVLFYQVGDFYEMFYEDAYIAQKVLDLTLTGKGSDKTADRVPMCGIPMHAVDNYLPRLVQAGYKVAVCEQRETEGKNKLMTREVVKIVTPGTMMDQVDETKNNYIAAISKHKDTFGITYADITTGKLSMVLAHSLTKLEDELNRIRPSEILVMGAVKELEKDIHGIKIGVIPPFSEYTQAAFDYNRALKKARIQFNVASLSVFDVTEEHKPCVMSLGALLEYLDETQKRVLTNLNKIEVQKSKEFLVLDSATRRNLELTENMTTKKKRGSLLGLYSYTKTNMGARLMRNYLEEPITSVDEINYRLDGVEELFSSTITRTNAMDILKTIADIERLSGKIAYGSIMPQELLRLADSLSSVQTLKEMLEKSVASKIIKDQLDKITDFSQVISLINSAIDENAPNNLSNGGYIKKGFDERLDNAKRDSHMGKQWLIEFENTLKQQTGIKNLRVSYNRVFGYYIEVSKSQVDLVPDSWKRRQTTANGERYINDDLKEKEEKILGAEDEALKVEAEIYGAIKQYLLSTVREIQDASGAVATIDVLCCMAELAVNNNYVRPTIGENITTTQIVAGRHPVVEDINPSIGFVPNDTTLDNGENRTMLITGPNMAGKSTYMRQVAIITIMTHMGSFVPAKSATIAPTDRIFTRIGASDDLAYGQSTFMVEMTELSNILNNATNKSLLLLDEIGRGTSTYDGLSIAWAVLEHLSKTLNCKTLFATHYHELIDLEGKIEGIKNYRVLIREMQGGIVFLHKIARGSANKSFGIEVASIAGLPQSVVDRAKEILAIQEEANMGAAKVSFDSEQIVNSNTKKGVNVDEVINVLSDIDMNEISPLVAFSTLQNLVDKVRK